MKLPWTPRSDLDFLMFFRTRHQSGTSELDVNLNSISRFTVSTCGELPDFSELLRQSEHHPVFWLELNITAQPEVRGRRRRRKMGRCSFRNTRAPPAVQPNSDSSLVNSGKHVYGNMKKIPETLPESWSFKLCRAFSGFPSIPLQGTSASGMMAT